MISALSYEPRSTPLGRASAGAAALHLTSFAAIAFVVANPLVLAGCAIAVVIAGAAAGTLAALRLAARWAAVLGALIVAVNALAAQRGATLLVRGPDVPVLGTLDVSAEALAEGGVLALRIAIVVAAFAVFSACIDPDRLLRLARPVARRSALTATLIARLVPLAAADRTRLADGSRLRGPGAAPVGRIALVRRLVAGSLDRAVDIAATLELRGYTGRTAPAAAHRASRAPGDLGFALSGAGALLLACAARLAGAAGYTSYPVIAIDAGLGVVALSAAIAAAPLVPLALDRVRAGQRHQSRLAHA